MKYKQPSLLRFILMSVFLAVGLACLFVSVGSAQAVSPAAGTTVVVTAPTPWYANADLLAVIFSVVTTLYGVWAHKGKATADKINETLVVGIEAATKIPAVAHAEAEIKAKIQKTAEQYGVQPILHRLVKDLTDDPEAITDGPANDPRHD